MTSKCALEKVFRDKMAPWSVKKSQNGYKTYEVLCRLHIRQAGISRVQDGLVDIAYVPQVLSLKLHIPPLHGLSSRHSTHMPNDWRQKVRSVIVQSESTAHRCPDSQEP